ncbi:MAG: ATP-binding protein [Pseudomonadota bacterium]
MSDVALSETAAPDRPARPAIPPTAAGHFVLHFYAAVFDLLRQIRVVTGTPAGFAEILSEHPFLKGYMDELSRALPMPDPLDAGRDAWRAAIDAHALQCAAPLPIAALQAQGLSDAALRLLILSGLVEEDGRFGDLFAWLQVGTGTRRLSLGFAETILGPLDQSRSSGAPWRELAAFGLIRPAQRDTPRAEQTICVPADLWSLIRGEAPHPPQTALMAPVSLTPPDRLIFPDPLPAKLAESAKLLADRGPKTLVLRGDTGIDMGAVAAALLSPGGRRALLIKDRPDAETMRHLGAWLTMAGCAPVYLLELGPGEVAEGLRPHGYTGPVLVAPGPEGGINVGAGDTQVTLDLPPLPPTLRKQVWIAALGQKAVDDIGPALSTLHVSEGYARRIAAAAQTEARLEGRARPQASDIKAAARALNHQLLDGLADRMDTSQDWSALIAAPNTHSMLRVLEDQARNREALNGRMGPAFNGGAAEGVRALFTGVSGTGKTMCARLLAGALGKQLYRVDLASVVNKYIGETEKNLGRVLSRAEALDVVLLLDEGDALLGTRTEVKSANDRYANLETNYLLQRLERYRGIILITTNFGDNIDKAFQRRMDVVVTFYRPSADQREAILRLHMPPDAAVSPALITEAMLRCDLTGGQIRNVATRAALAALSDGMPLGDDHFLQALGIEHEKAGAIFPLGVADDAPDVRPTGARSFAAALRSGR